MKFFGGILVKKWGFSAEKRQNGDIQNKILRNFFLFFYLSIVRNNVEYIEPVTEI